MKRSILLLWVALLFSQGLMAQENERQNLKTGFWKFKLGPGIERLQDLKSSPLKLSGTAVPFGIYRGRVSDNSISSGGIEIHSSKLQSSNDQVIQLSSSVINLHFDYMKKLPAATELFDTWYLGGRVDLRRQNLENELLGNNMVKSLLSSSLSIISRVERSVQILGKSSRLSYTLSVAPLSFVKEDNSFAFSAPQGALEEGDYNTQDFEHGLFEYGELTSLNKFTRIRSRLAIHFPAKRRSSWILAYEWKLQKYTPIEGFGQAMASHDLSMSFYLPKKKK
ncbi:MAG: hypothetical protein HEP71_29630 [Roseivirga sp.]|nr:hypothetical protein [Roseivirga sp.]